MKKSNLLTLLFTTIISLFIISSFAFADDTWNGSDTTGDAWRDGNVGIGTASPGKQLHIEGASLNDVAIRLVNTFPATNNIWDIYPGINGVTNTGFSLYDATNNATRFAIDNTGNVGIGTTNPSHKLHIYTGGANVKTYTYGLETTVNTTGGWARSFRIRNEYDNVTSAFGSLHGCAYIATGFDISTDPTGYQSAHFFITNNGNVGIGTTSPGTYKLNVAGSVRANEIVVNTTGADYVFEDEYKLKPLEEVAEYIEKEKHLPEIPSASEMKENGVGVSEMQSKLLAKVEELTLYVIEQNKQISVLKEENAEIKQKLKKLVN